MTLDERMDMADDLVKTVMQREGIEIPLSGDEAESIAMIFALKLAYSNRCISIEEYNSELDQVIAKEAIVKP